MANHDKKNSGLRGAFAFKTFNINSFNDSGNVWNNNWNRSRPHTEDQNAQSNHLLQSIGTWINNHASVSSNKSIRSTESGSRATYRRRSSGGNEDRPCVNLPTSNTKEMYENDPDSGGVYPRPKLRHLRRSSIGSDNGDYRRRSFRDPFDLGSSSDEEDVLLPQNTHWNSTQQNENIQRLKEEQRPSQEIELDRQRQEEQKLSQNGSLEEPFPQKEWSDDDEQVGVDDFGWGANKSYASEDEAFCDGGFGYSADKNNDIHADEYKECDADYDRNGYEDDDEDSFEDSSRSGEIYVDFGGKVLPKSARSAKSSRSVPTKQKQIETDRSNPSLLTPIIDSDSENDGAIYKPNLQQSQEMLPSAGHEHHMTLFQSDGQPHQPPKLQQYLQSSDEFLINSSYSSASSGSCSLEDEQESHEMSCSYESSASSASSESCPLDGEEDGHDMGDSNKPFASAALSNPNGDTRDTLCLQDPRPNGDVIVSNDNTDANNRHDESQNNTPNIHLHASSTKSNETSSAPSVSFFPELQVSASSSSESCVDIENNAGEFGKYTLDRNSDVKDPGKSLVHHTPCNQQSSDTLGEDYGFYEFPSQPEPQLNGLAAPLASPQFSDSVLANANESNISKNPKSQMKSSKSTSSLLQLKQTFHNFSLSSPLSQQRRDTPDSQKHQSQAQSQPQQPQSPTPQQEMPIIPESPDQRTEEENPRLVQLKQQTTEELRSELAKLQVSSKTNLEKTWAEAENLRVKNSNLDEKVMELERRLAAARAAWLTCGMGSKQNNNEENAGRGSNVGLNNGKRKTRRFTISATSVIAEEQEQNNPDNNTSQRNNSNNGAGFSIFQQFAATSVAAPPQDPPQAAPPIPPKRKPRQRRPTIHGVASISGLNALASNSNGNDRNDGEMLNSSGKSPLRKLTRSLSARSIPNLDQDSDSMAKIGGTEDFLPLFRNNMNGQINGFARKEGGHAFSELTIGAGGNDIFDPVTNASEDYYDCGLDIDDGETHCINANYGNRDDEEGHDDYESDDSSDAVSGVFYPPPCSLPANNATINSMKSGDITNRDFRTSTGANSYLSNNFEGRNPDSVEDEEYDDDSSDAKSGVFYPPPHPQYQNFDNNNVNEGEDTGTIDTNEYKDDSDDSSDVRSGVFYPPPLMSTGHDSEEESDISSSAKSGVFYPPPCAMNQRDGSEGDDDDSSDARSGVFYPAPNYLQDAEAEEDEDDSSSDARSGVFYPAPNYLQDTEAEEDEDEDDSSSDARSGVFYPPPDEIESDDEVDDEMVASAAYRLSADNQISGAKRGSDRSSGRSPGRNNHTSGRNSNENGNTIAKNSLPSNTLLSANPAMCLPLEMDDFDFDPLSSLAKNQNKASKQKPRAFALNSKKSDDKDAKSIPRRQSFMALSLFVGNEDLNDEPNDDDSITDLPSRPIIGNPRRKPRSSSSSHDHSDGFDRQSQIESRRNSRQVIIDGLKSDVLQKDAEIDKLMEIIRKQEEEMKGCQKEIDFEATRYDNEEKELLEKEVGLQLEIKELERYDMDIDSKHDQVEDSLQKARDEELSLGKELEAHSQPPRIMNGVNQMAEISEEDLEKRLQNAREWLETYQKRYVDALEKSKGALGRLENDLQRMCIPSLRGDAEEDADVSGEVMDRFADLHEWENRLMDVLSDKERRISFAVTYQRVKEDQKRALESYHRFGNLGSDLRANFNQHTMNSGYENETFHSSDSNTASERRTYERMFVGTVIPHLEIAKLSQKNVLDALSKSEDVLAWWNHTLQIQIDYLSTPPSKPPSLCSDDMETNDTKISEPPSSVYRIISTLEQVMRTAKEDFATVHAEVKNEYNTFKCRIGDEVSINQNDSRGTFSNDDPESRGEMVHNSNGSDIYCTNLEIDNEDRQRPIEEAEAELERVDSEISSLVASVAEREATYDKHSFDLETLRSKGEEESKSNLQDLDKLQQEVKDTLIKLAEEDSVIASLKTLLKEKEVNVRKMESMLQGRESKIQETEEVFFPESWGERWREQV